MDAQRELRYRPLKVYVIRNKNGAFAPGTKVYPSKAGGTMGYNSFVEGMICYYLSHDNPVYRQYEDELDWLANHWSWGGGKKDFVRYEIVRDELASPHRYRSPVKITRQAYDEFMRIINKIHDEWGVEEVAQDYA